MPNVRHMDLPGGPGGLIFLRRRGKCAGNSLKDQRDRDGAGLSLCDDQCSRNTSEISVLQAELVFRDVQEAAGAFAAVRGPQAR